MLGASTALWSSAFHLLITLFEKKTRRNIPCAPNLFKFTRVPSCTFAVCIHLKQFLQCDRAISTIHFKNLHNILSISTFLNSFISRDLLECLYTGKRSQMLTVTRTVKITRLKSHIAGSKAIQSFVNVLFTLSVRLLGSLLRDRRLDVCHTSTHGVALVRI